MSSAAGDRRAEVDGLVALHGGEVLRISRAILRDEHLGADAAQETFLRLWTRLSAERAPAALGGWLRSVAVSTALDAARRRRARADAEGLRGDDERRSAASPARPEALAARAELARRLEAALAHLPEGQRTVFELRHFGGLSLPEVAEALGLAVPTAKTHFARACLKLQAALARFADPDQL
jgi:RNA polymerase sigma-70 factor (ECF subfamily)